MAKDWRRIWKVGSLCILWVVWKARKDVVFRVEVLSLKKSIFFWYILFGWKPKFSFVNGSTTLVNFINWVVSFT